MPALGDGLTLRTAADADDVERVAAFDGHIHGERVTPMTRRLFLHHPNTSLDDLVFVEDEESGEVVSSLCLIPWTWRCEGVEIPAGEMGIVGTLEDYRSRGLVRKQVDVFKQRLRERGCLLSHIQGIPHFYRQFGYEYALPLERRVILETRQVPDPPKTAFTFRQATADDLPTLMRLYDEAADDLAIHAVRDEAIWRYLLTRSPGTETERDTWLIEDPTGETAGYVCVAHHHFGAELRTSEVSRLSFDAALATLDHLKRLSVERDEPGIRLDLPADCTLMQVARSLDARDGGTYAWQIHIPDAAALLRTLASVLERRVAGSSFAGLSRDVRISLYRSTIRLRFEGGSLAEVSDVGPTTWHEEPIRVPPLQLAPLVLGHRSWRELHQARPGVDIDPQWRVLVDTLFPKVPAFIYTIY